MCTWRLGTVQFAPQRLQRDANLAAIGRLVGGAAGADLLVLPELADTGYLFEDRAEVLRHATAADGAVVSHLSALSAAHGVMLVTGFAERAGDRVFNSAALTTPEGVVHIYRKVHLFDREKELFDPGDRPFSVVKAGGIRLGIMICFDWIFPEAARSLALLGAQVIAHPSNLVLPWAQRAMETRCLENRVFAATANRFGRESLGDRTLVFTGQSQVVSPLGERLVAAPAEGERVDVVDVDPEEADRKQVTSTNEVLADRRPEAYTH